MPVDVGEKTKGRSRPAKEEVKEGLSLELEKAMKTRLVDRAASWSF
jgi:hypothetical protein